MISLNGQDLHVKFINPVEFADFSDNHLELWSKIKGAKIHHSTYGARKIIHVEQRPEYIPLIYVGECSQIAKALAGLPAAGFPGQNTSEPARHATIPGPPGPSSTQRARRPDGHPYKSHTVLVMELML